MTKEKYTSLSEALGKSRKKHPDKSDLLAHRIKKVESGLKINQRILYFAVFIFLIAFLGFAIDAWRYHANEYEEYRETVDSLKKEINEQEKEIMNYRITLLQEKIKELNERKQSNLS